MSRTLNYSDIYKFCAGLCNSVEESRDTNKLLICQRKCHDGMVEEGFANGRTKKLPRKSFKNRRGIFKRTKKMLFKPVRYIYRKFVPKNYEDYNMEPVKI